MNTIPTSECPVPDEDWRYERDRYKEEDREITERTASHGRREP